MFFVGEDLQDEVIEPSIVLVCGLVVEVILAAGHGFRTRFASLLICI